MKIRHILACSLCLVLFICPLSHASGDISVKEDEQTLEEPEEEYFEEQTDDNTVTAKKTKKLKVTKQEDIVNKRIFIGDSRTVGMCLAVTDLTYTKEKTIIDTDENGYVWIAKSGEGLTFMKENDSIEEDIIDGTNIYILMGVNDCRFRNTWHLYRDYVNEKGKAWGKLGANVIFVSVLPIMENSKSSLTTEEEVEEFNEYMKENIEVQYLDVFSMIETDAEFAKDGLHYTKEQYVKIYNLITGE